MFLYDWCNIITHKSIQIFLRQLNRFLFVLDALLCIDCDIHVSIKDPWVTTLAWATLPIHIWIYCILFNVPLENYSLIWRRHYCQCWDCSEKPMIYASRTLAPAEKKIILSWRKKDRSSSLVWKYSINACMDRNSKYLQITNRTKHLRRWQQQGFNVAHNSCQRMHMKSFTKKGEKRKRRWFESFTIE